MTVLNTIVIVVKQVDIYDSVSVGLRATLTYIITPQ